MLYVILLMIKNSCPRHGHRLLAMGIIKRLRVTQRQRSIERTMLGYVIKPEIDTWTRNRVTDIAQRIAMLKWQWAGARSS